MIHLEMKPVDGQIHCHIECSESQLDQAQAKALEQAMEKVMQQALVAYPKTEGLVIDTAGAELKFEAVQADGSTTPLGEALTDLLGQMDEVVQRAGLHAEIDCKGLSPLIDTTAQREVTLDQVDFSALDQLEQKGEVPPKFVRIIKRFIQYLFVIAPAARKGVAHGESAKKWAQELQAAHPKMEGIYSAEELEALFENRLEKVSPPEKSIAEQVHDDLTLLQKGMRRGGSIENIGEVRNRLLSLENFDQVIPPMGRDPTSFERVLQSICGRFTREKVALPKEVLKRTIGKILQMKRLRDEEASIQELTRKLEALVPRMESDPESIEDDMRLSKRELGKLLSLRLKCRSVKKSNPDLLTSSQSVFLALADRLAAHLREEFKDHYRNGDVLMTSPSQKEELTGQRPSINIRIAAALTEYGYRHAAKIFHRDSQVCLSEVNAKHMRQRLDVFTATQSDVWRLDLAKLIPESHHAKLEEQLGADWKSEVESMYSKCEGDYHHNQSVRIRNPTNRQIAAGFPRLARLLGLSSDAAVRRKTPRDFKKLHDQLMGTAKQKKTHTEMICSEFATKSTIVALVELNERLAERLGLPEGEEVIKIPFDPMYKIKRIHGGKMIQMLQGVVTKVEKPPGIRRILRDG